MTFAARNHVVAGAVRSPLGTLAVRDVKPFVSASASAQFTSAGGIAYTGNQSTGPATWYDPTTTGVGSGFWIKFTLSSGSAWDAGLVSGTLYQISSARTLTWSATAGISKTASVAVQVYADAGGTQLVSSGTMAVYSSGMN